jgi:hypothetical protein
MALTRETTVKSVTCSSPTDSCIILTQVLKEDGVEKSSKDFVCNLDKTDSVPKKVAGIISEMQTDADNYKRAKTILNSTALANAIAAINAGVTL